MRSNANNDDDFRDDDLRARFVKLRREEEAQTPEFALPTRAFAVRKRRWHFPGLIAATSLLAVMLAGFLWVRFGPSASNPISDSSVASLVEWKSPTDFLLETPGRELLQTVPAIGVFSDSSQAPTPKHEHPTARKKVSP